MKIVLSILGSVCIVFALWGMFELLDYVVRSIGRKILIRRFGALGKTKEWDRLLVEEENGVILINKAKNCYWGLKYWWLPSSSNSDVDPDADAMLRWSRGDGFVILEAPRIEQLDTHAHPYRVTTLEMCWEHHQDICCRS